jgi:hypothetical protein
MSMNNLFESTGIWPVTIGIGGQAGWTLWASTENDDYVLAAEKQILLFRTCHALKEFVVDNQSNNLATLPGYEAFRTACLTAPSMALEPYARYDLTDLIHIMDEDWIEWNREQVSVALDALNILWDMAITVDEHDAIRLMSGDAVLGTVMNVMTMFDEEGRQELGQIRQCDVKRRVMDVVRGVSRHVLLLPEESKRGE